MFTLVTLLLTAAATPTEPWCVDAPGFSMTIAPEGMAALQDASGYVYAAGGGTQGLGILRIDQSHWAASWGTPEEFTRHPELTLPNTRICAPFAGLTNAAVACTTEVDPASGDLVFSQHAVANEKGVWGVQWTLGPIPLDLNIIIPGRSGIKLTRTTPRTAEVFDYPMEWEAQLVIIEGQGRGCYVWADDPEGRFKRLTVNRTAEGWRLGFITMNTGSSDDRNRCISVPWRIATYEGDWRVPARRYRDWAAKHFAPTPIQDQHPDWVRDIRACVIMGLDRDTLEALPARMDPKQTLLYLPDWRKSGYDRDYPTYDQPVDALVPFIARAHELGYRVMLHVNYFGVDPLNPLFPQFEPYQIRSFWGTHEKEWWLWERATPIIKFAYINPALAEWRELFVERMTALCHTCQVDALHLDQTLCIYNDYNGEIDGVSMIEGNVRLHRELREALPEVALSGEGLNEITYRYEAFAQRHAWGLNHADGTYDPALLATAHPISAYLLGPYTRMYGYLGYAPPTDAAIYAAWNDAYEHWGIIPTLKPNKDELQQPRNFSKQLFAEAAFWFETKPEPDWDAPWPNDVIFPFRAADGSTAARMRDGALLWGSREISRTVRGVTEVVLPGTIPGWRAFDDTRIFGLDPSNGYPYFNEPRDPAIFHITQLPQGVMPAAILTSPNVAAIRTTDRNTCVADLINLMGEAVCSSEPVNGPKTMATGSLDAPDGGSCYPSGKTLFAHPPWKTPGSGVTRARFALHLPEDAVNLRFIANVALDQAAAQPDRSDGVTFSVTATSGELVSMNDVHNATSTPESLELNLTSFAGRDVTLDLTVDPGPQGNVSYDWARWHEPRIERTWRATDTIAIAGAPGWTLALSGTTSTPIDPAQPNHVITAQFPGILYLLKQTPAPITLPVDITAAERNVLFASEQGAPLEAPLHATAEPGESTVAGITRKGLFTHPPDHGQTWALHPMTLPANPAEFHAWVGIRDGSKSGGAIAYLDVNGVQLAAISLRPGTWHEVTADLSPWAGQPVVITLITDANGGYNCDWVQWGEPTLREKQAVASPQP